MCGWRQFSSLKKENWRASMGLSPRFISHRLGFYHPRSDLHFFLQLALSPGNFQKVGRVILMGNLFPRVSETHAAAAAKSLQSSPPLCDPIDGSPPGFPIPGILQARTLEWVAISFSNTGKWSRSVVSDSSDPMDCSLPGSSIRGIFQTRVLEWIAIAFSKWDPQTRWKGQGTEGNERPAWFLSPWVVQVGERSFSRKTGYLWWKKHTGQFLADLTTGQICRGRVVS